MWSLATLTGVLLQENVRAFRQDKQSSRINEVTVTRGHCTIHSRTHVRSRNLALVITCFHLAVKKVILSVSSCSLKEFKLFESAVSCMRVGGYT